MTPKGNNPIIDHALLGPTYKDIVLGEGRRYTSVYRGGKVTSIDAIVVAFCIIQEKIDIICRWIIANTVLRFLRGAQFIAQVARRTAQLGRRNQVAAVAGEPAPAALEMEEAKQLKPSA